MKIVISILFMGLYTESTQTRVLGPPPSFISALLDSAFSDPPEPAYVIPKPSRAFRLKSKILRRAYNGNRAGFTGVEPLRRPSKAPGKLRRFRVNSKHYRKRRINRRRSSITNASTPQQLNTSTAQQLNLSTLTDLMDLISQRQSPSPSGGEESPIQLVANVIGSISDGNPSALLPSLINRLVSESSMANSASVFSDISDLLPALSSLVPPSSGEAPDSTQPDAIGMISDMLSEDRGENPCEAAKSEGLELPKRDIDPPYSSGGGSEPAGDIGQPPAEATEDPLLKGLMDLLLDTQGSNQATRNPSPPHDLVNLKLEPPSASHKPKHTDALYDSIHENILDNIEDNTVHTKRHHRVRRYKKGRLYPSQHRDASTPQQLNSTTPQQLSSESILKNLFTHSPYIPARNSPVTHVYRAHHRMSAKAKNIHKIGTHRGRTRVQNVESFSLKTGAARRKRSIFGRVSRTGPAGAAPVLSVDRSSETDGLFDLYLSQQAHKAKLARRKRQKIDFFARGTPYVPSQLATETVQPQVLGQQEYSDMSEHSMGYIDYAPPYFTGQIAPISLPPVYLYQPLYVPPPPVDYRYVSGLPYQSEWGYASLPPAYGYTEMTPPPEAKVESIGLAPPVNVDSVTLPPPVGEESIGLAPPSASRSSLSPSSSGGYERSSASQTASAAKQQATRQSVGSEASGRRKTRIEFNVVNSPTTELLIQPSAPQPDQDCFNGNCDQFIAAEIKSLMADNRLV